MKQIISLSIALVINLYVIAGGYKIGDTARDFSLKNIDGKMVVGSVQLCRRHAGAVERNAVAQNHVIKITRRGFDGELLAMI